VNEPLESAREQVSPFAPRKATRRAIFLDRDGVLNRAVVRDGKPYPPANLGELDIPAAVPGALQLAKNAGFVLIGVTNQPDVARKTTARETVEAINREILQSLPLVEIRVCYHDDRDGCDCRKPKPGLLLQAAAEHQIDLRRSCMIGDRWRDVEAGRRAGCHTIWIDCGYREHWPVAPPDQTVRSLTEAIQYVIETKEETTSCVPNK
jgi:D-glycero-D-manno-heptose 1,7-bisphosphate phosphatase